MHKSRWSITLSPVLLAAVTAGGGVACSHSGTAVQPEAKEAVSETRGLCPTDLNQSQMVVREGPGYVAVAFRTDDPSKVQEVSRRAAEVGEALASVHPAVNDQGQLVQHTPAPKPQLRELADGTGQGVELLFQSSDEGRQILAANLADHERMWRLGECPIMSDESVRDFETRKWPKVDR